MVFEKILFCTFLKTLLCQPYNSSGEDRDWNIFDSIYALHHQRHHCLLRADKWCVLDGSLDLECQFVLNFHLLAHCAPPLSPLVTQRFLDHQWGQLGPPGQWRSAFWIIKEVSCGSWVSNVTLFGSSRRSARPNVPIPNRSRTNNPIRRDRAWWSKYLKGQLVPCVGHMSFLDHQGGQSLVSHSLGLCTVTVTATVIQSEMSAGDTMRGVENTPNCILARRSSVGTPPIWRHRT